VRQHEKDFIDKLFFNDTGLGGVLNAEGAWVLWGKWHYPNPTKEEALEYINTGWQLSNAYPNYEMCIKKDRGNNKRSKETMGCFPSHFI
jgi:hypothetical protein